MTAEIRPRRFKRLFYRVGESSQHLVVLADFVDQSEEQGEAYIDIKSTIWHKPALPTNPPVCFFDLPKAAWWLSTTSITSATETCL